MSISEISNPDPLVNPLEEKKLPFGIRYCLAVNRLNLFILLIGVSAAAFYTLLVLIASLVGNGKIFFEAGIFLLAISGGGVKALKSLTALNKQLRQKDPSARPRQIFWSALFLTLFPIGTLAYGISLLLMLYDGATKQAFSSSGSAAPAPARKKFWAGLGTGFLVIIFLVISGVQLTRCYLKYGGEMKWLSTLQENRALNKRKKARKVSQITLHTGQTIEGNVVGEDETNYFVQESGKSLKLIKKTEVSELH